MPADGEGSRDLLEARREMLTPQDDVISGAIARNQILSAAPLTVLLKALRLCHDC